MNTRNRFLGTLSYQSVDHVPDFEFGYWPECLELWKSEGFPDEIQNDWDAERYFGFEYYCGLPINNGICPHFERKILEVRGDRQLVQDSEGVICEEPLSGTSVPKYIRFPIETKEDWVRFRTERLDPETRERIPDDIENIIAHHKDREYPLFAPCGSIYGWLRNWMGIENFSIAIATESDWVEEMMEHLVDLTISVLSRVIDKVQFDFGNWWEDMAYNHGPLVSPRFFSQIMVPKYKKITSFLAQHGVKYHVLDCDGKIDELVPGWLEAGINVMFPLEAAHTNQPKLRREFGKDLRFMGGVNKVALIRSKAAIDEELKRIAELLEDGGYIPHIDHRCPPDVSLENYRYYVDRKREIIQL